MRRNIQIHTQYDEVGGFFSAWVVSDSQRPIALNACARSGDTAQTAFNRCMEAYRASHTIADDAVFSEAT